MPDPIGAVIVIVPVAILQVGCVKVTVGATGAEIPQLILPAKG